MFTFVKVWNFLIDREIEAPERFEYIQTNRAAKAILQLQKSFLKSLADRGAIDEFEYTFLIESVELKMSRLYIHGYPTKSITIIEFLRSMPIFTDVTEVTLFIKFQFKLQHRKYFKKSYLILDCTYSKAENYL